MARHDYLSTDERIRFDSPPQLSSTQRLIFADLPLWADQFLTAIHTPTNKAGFVLQLGYFRVVTRFFIPDRFSASDVAWVSRQLQLPAHQIRLGEYTNNRTLYRHRATILAQLGYAAFGEEHRQALEQEASRLTHLQTRPALMLDVLVAYLRE